MQKLSDIAPGVIDELAARRAKIADGLTEYDGQTCENCGGAWFNSAVTLNTDGTVSGYVFPLTCTDCGHEIQPASNRVR